MKMTSTRNEILDTYSTATLLFFAMDKILPVEGGEVTKQDKNIGALVLDYLLEKAGLENNDAELQNTESLEKELLRLYGEALSQ